MHTGTIQIITTNKNEKKLCELHVVSFFCDVIDEWRGEKGTYNGT